MYKDTDLLVVYLGHPLKIPITMEGLMCTLFPAEKDSPQPITLSSTPPTSHGVEKNLNRSITPCSPHILDTILLPPHISARNISHGSVDSPGGHIGNPYVVHYTSIS